MRYLVDGYNVTMADDATRRLPREDQRDALVRRLSVRGEDLPAAGRITVVFDGHWGTGAASGTGRVEVKFSTGETADDVIVRLAGSSEDALVVVTSDRALRDRVREVASVSVEFRGCSALFESTLARVPRRRAKGRFPAATAGLPDGANRITEELKGIWLDESEE